ncbi:structural maintenance of chromosomes protein, putative [Entamoeba dispar SAW760]|uniref:Structural maintenance of chromosomes protein n=1 Tax=Entamoeba dispar (strain ATCC PRA-260 / SAW760) TaxID=370354 RepID=B0EGQ9_ENTDS|nr:structural maintenance of chromosomes protein, putative [Entamoeba dispar SAW760]EDR26299.1 structural maintenance of chromosomes protein, putative [Entamoeba dispar SAW760]|eukprot:EDR26299.1 structural maintenance of chromosomes protein, putative [Entamoeba dispar SAW760]
MVFIKRISLKGFKSYQEQLNFEEFDPHYNIIIGRNGTGKSNFYDAIQFVLCDEKFGNLRASDRQFLLYEGNGESVVSGFVEVVFDNSDRRFMIEKDEVSVKRCIGLQKDEYFINDKRSKKEEVMNLLESAGFSRSNPYYIVQQNRVNSLAMMKDSERLDLLREIAGTRVYDERREESFKMLKENQNKIEQIEEVMNYIKERLTELQEEQEELNRYEELDKKRRGIEYSITENKIKEIEKELEENTKERKEESHIKEEKEEEEIKEVKRKRRILKEEVNILEERRINISNQIQEAEGLKIEGEIRQEGRKEIKEMKEEIKRAKKRSEEIKEEINKINQEEKENNDKIKEKRIEEAEAQAKVEEFYNKIGRKAKYSNDEEYKEAIEKEIKEIKENNEKIEKEKKELQKEIEEMKKIKENQINIQEKQENFKGKIKMEELRKKKEEIGIKKRINDNKINNFENTRERLMKELIKLYKRAEGTRIKKQLIIGEYLKKYVEEKGINKPKIKYYGTVIENISSEEKLYTAIEASSGNGLLYCIVEDDETATKLIKVLEEKKIGRMSFIPLNQIKRKEEKEGEETEKVKSLIKNIKYKEEVKKAIEFVFGNTMICEKGEDAIEYQKENQNKCVSFDGDVFNGKGIVTGGYRGEKIIEIIKNIEEKKEKIKEIEKDIARSETEKKIIEEEQKEIMKEMEEMNSKITEEEIKYEKERIERIIKIKKSERIRENIKNKEKRIEEKEKIIIRNTQKLLILQNEKENKNIIDRNKIEEAKKKLEEIQNKVREIEKKRVEIENKRQILRNEYQFGIINKINEIERKMREIESGGEENDIEKYKEIIIKNMEELKKINEEIEKKIQEERILEEKQENIEKEKEKKEKIEKEREKKMNRLFEKMTILESKKKELIKRKEEIGKNYVEIKGNKEELENFLEETMKEIKKYRHVNKKAKDQYKGFIEQQEGLIDRKKEILDTQKTIYSLIENLDEKKEEAIERTFKGVSKGFTEIFNKLVPQGKGTLVMLKKPYEKEQFTQSTLLTQSQSENNFSILSLPKKIKTETYSGISLRVIFPAFGGDAKTIQQLSGGQKTVVALSLIFAIQRCDPAPFYLFDEIDSNLDTLYREAVATLIQQQSKEAQYLVTTFRPELILPANKWYEIKHQNKVSTILPISKDDALKVIKEEGESHLINGYTPFQTPIQTPQRIDSSEQLTPNI